MAMTEVNSSNKAVMTGKRVVSESATGHLAEGVVIVDEVGDRVVTQPVSLPAVQSDGFGRIRTSGTGQRLDVEFIYDKQPDFFDEITNNGTVTHNPNSRDLTLALLDAVAGSYSLMRSHPVPYTPGNSQMEDITSVLDLAGIGGGVAQVFLRSSVTGVVDETVVDQGAWSKNQAADADWTKSHIFQLDFQSLKVGLIRFVMVRKGGAVIVHEMDNDNKIDTGYWQMPSLPAYWRIYNDATYTYMECGYGDEANAIGFRYRITANAAATMRAICVTVKSEGGQDLVDMGGLPRTADNGVTPVTASTSLVPILSIRPGATFNGFANLGIAIPVAIDVETNNPIRLAVIHNATLTGAVWAAVGDSMMESDVTATAITGGHEVDSGYVSSSAKNRATSAGSLLGKTVLWARNNGLTGSLTVAAIRTGGTDAAILAALKWKEIR